MKKNVNKQVQKSRMTMRKSIYIRYLHQDCKVRGKELLKRFPGFSKATIYRHAKRAIDDPVSDHRQFNKGRPTKLNDRAKRSILRVIPRLREEYGSFTVKRLKLEASLDDTVSDRSIRRCLNSLGYRYKQSRRKGLMSKKDLQLRMKFAKNVKRLPNYNQLWRDKISFYLDGVGFVHKYNPKDQARSTRSMAWRKKGEGLHLFCTQKGKKAGTGGRMAHFIVAIAYGKGVICCQQYDGTITGKLFAKFIHQNFDRMFADSADPIGKQFLQDGCPSQNSKAAKDAMDVVGATLFPIPARSPDLNPIENLFAAVNRQLDTDAVEQNITSESYEQFSDRVQSTLEKYPVVAIDKLIGSMDKRIELIIKGKGERLKY